MRETASQADIIETNPPRTGARILVVGATGAFGSRLVESLVRTTGHDILIAGRNFDALHDLSVRMEQLRPGALVEPVSFDRNTVSAEEIAALDPLVVVDAAGPFQNDDLTFAQEVILAGRHYVDLADARDFIANFGQLNAMAKDAGVVAITGCSTTPALSIAALDMLTNGWERLDKVEVAVAPGAAGPRGLSVVKSILSYAGQPVMVLVDGEWIYHPGWGMTTRRFIPGVGRRWLSLCATPDLDLIPDRWPDVMSVVFRASGGPAILHLGLGLASLLVRMKLMRSLKPLARPLTAIAGWAGRFCSETGGMTVRAEGVDQNGRAVIAEWSLVAEGGDGPHIPTLPALAIIRALADAAPRPADAGAIVASRIFDLSLFAEEASRFKIKTRVKRSYPEATTLFERVLGPTYQLLPHAVRRAHAPDPEAHMTGEVAVEKAETQLGCMVGSIFGFPSATAETSSSVWIAKNAGEETWTRRFGEAEFSSRLAATDQPGILTENFGPLHFDLGMKAESDGFRMEVIGWKLLGLRLPTRLAPKTTARGYADQDGAYRFDVRIWHPWLGRLVGYKGRLSPTASAAE